MIGRYRAKCRGPWSFNWLQHPSTTLYRMACKRADINYLERHKDRKESKDLFSSSELFISSSTGPRRFTSTATSELDSMMLCIIT